MTKRAQKITFGEMRQSGVFGVVVFCGDYRCSHSTTLPAIKMAFAARRARGASIGRPTMPDQCKEALERLESGETQASVALELWPQRGYGSPHGAFARLSGGHRATLFLH